MLAVTSYDRAYVQSCRAQIDERLAAYRAVVAAFGGVQGALADFETSYFSGLVLVLEQSFVHRLRTNEKKDGNALNEVRLLVASLLTNDGKLVADKQIKLKPETSVLGLNVGDPIEIREADFVRLADAFFAEILAKF